MKGKALQIIRKNLFTYFNLIFAAIAALLILVGSFRDLTFMIVVFFNTAIGIVQQIHSQRVLDRLAILHQQKVSVLRDGEELRVPVEELLVSDTLILAAGNQIPADGTVSEGEIYVNEALVTGESDEILKRPGDSLLSGSFVVSGSCRAELTAVGEDSYIAGLTARATRQKGGEQSEMIRCLNRLIRAVGIVIIPIGALLFGQQYWLSGASFRDSVTAMVAALIGMIPEGLYLLTSVALAVSTARLAGQSVLIHDMKCIEALARVDVLCVDKTGTITSPEMSVESLVPLNGKDEETVGAKLSEFVGAFSADNATMAAIRRQFGHGRGKKASEVLPFSSETKFCGAVLGGETWILGAPEMLLKENYGQYSETIRARGGNGRRILVFGRYDGPLKKEALHRPVRPSALIILRNPVRESARETFRYFAENQVEIKVISGDNPVTVSEVAREAGIPGSENYVDAGTLSGKKALEEAAGKYTVFGRVTPEQKLRLIRELKRQGRTVAMTGDGVNDVLALREADCSVAMASGSDAAAQASQLVLLDSDFSRMPSVVREGRRVVNNIERTASLFLVKNIFSMLLAVFSILCMWEYPMEPSQVSLIGIFTIGTPAFILSLERSSEQIKGHFLRNVMLKALPAGLADFLLVSTFSWVCRELDLGMTGLSTCCTVLMTLIGFEALYHISKPMTKTHLLLLIAMIAGWLISVSFLEPLFAIEPIPRKMAIILVLFMILAEPLMRYMRTFFIWLEREIINRRKEKRLMRTIANELWKTAAVNVILGAVLLIWPDVSVRLVGYLLGGAALLGGAVLLVRELVSREKTSGAMIVGGAALCAAGIFLCLRFAALLSVLPFLFGLMVLVSGLIKLQGALQERRAGFGGWIWTLITAILSIGLGILVISNPFSTVTLTLRVIGAVLLVNGLSNLADELFIRRKMRRQGYFVNEDEDGTIEVITKDR